MTGDGNNLQVQRLNLRLLIPDSNDSQQLCPILGYAQELLLPLVDACTPLIHIIHNILIYVSVALERTPNNPSDGLTRDESAAICLYTIEWNNGERSFYSILNETLNRADRKNLRPWFKYLKLFLTAMAKIPCEPQCTVWRGVKKKY
ncbi:unnamed protein product [Rotaria sp. Silwood2]|nr:unnamed protein product [Rotaria sp. Silwood2]